MERDFKGIWIPKEIWLSKELSLQEKVFFVEIDSLDNEQGCFASNQYFSEFFGLSKNRCSEVIKSLEKKKFISIEYIKEKDKNNIEKRIIRTINSTKRGIRKIEQGSRKVEEGIRNIERGYSEKCEDNNTSFNNTFNKELPLSENLKADIFDNGQNDGGQKKEPNKYEKIVNLYNDTCLELSKLIKLTEKRKTAINKLLKEYTVEEIEKGFKLFNESDFCKGINDRGWKADFDFCIKPDKMASVLEGKYKNNVKQAPVKPQATKPNKFHNFIQHEEQDLEAIARQKFEKKMNELRGSK